VISRERSERRGEAGGRAKNLIARLARRADVVLFVALAAAATLGACSDRKQPRFPHAVHLAGLPCGTPSTPECLDCNSCHAVSQLDREHKLPEGQTCARCHRDDAHDVLPVLATKPERISGEISFDHDRHLAMEGIGGQCVVCHAGVVQSDAPTMPAMSQCFSCHEHETQWKAGQCAPCHARADLERTLPKTFLRHDLGFLRHHGQLAREQEQMCTSCHSQSDCASCHDTTQTLAIERREPERVERSFVHRGDFMVRHAIEAQSQPSQCVRCHTVETCDSCHVARGVSANRIGSRNPHPPGWVGTNAASKSFHGREARRDIVACASCHEQGPATNCIRCHKVGGFGGNPHPGGWRSHQSKGSGTCRYCHG
jgi:hypothetical protein